MLTSSEQQVVVRHAWGHLKSGQRLADLSVFISCLTRHSDVIFPPPFCRNPPWVCEKHYLDGVNLVSLVLANP
jgi:hypothetical protein